MTTKPTERLLKLSQVALMANVSTRTVERDAHKGALRVVVARIGTRRRIRVREAEARRYAGMN